MRRSCRAGALAALTLLGACSTHASSGRNVGTTTASGPPSAQHATVDMTDRLTFRPGTVKAEVGTLTLTADNVGRIPHNLVFDSAALGRTDTVQGGATATLHLVLTRPGTYHFVCTFHPGMEGKVVVQGPGS
jgi:plastocyanin